MSLANQLYYFKSTVLEKLKLGKIYYLKNEAPDLFTEGIKHLQKSINLYNKLIKNNYKLICNNITEKKQAARRLIIAAKLESINKIINKLFTTAHEDAYLILYLSKLLI